MSEHLRLLQELFPKKIYLDEHDVASVFGVAVKTIVSKKYLQQLPFHVCSVTSKFRVSIVELARFMDEDKVKSKPFDNPLSIPSEVSGGKKVRRKSRSKIFKDQYI